MSEHGAVLTDKDGGFAIVSKDELRKEKLRLLSSGVYRRTAWHEDFHVDVMEEYCEAVNLFTDPGIKKALLSDYRRLKIVPYSLLPGPFIVRRCIPWNLE